MNELVDTLQPLRWDEPKSAYDVVIVGGGGHGLATAYYLATRHGITNVAVIEADYIASGNTGRNTTIIRANYGIPEAVRFYEHSLEMYEALEAETGAAILHQTKGLIWLAHTEMALRAERARCLMNTACRVLEVPDLVEVAGVVALDPVRDGPPLATIASRGRSHPGRWPAGSTSSSTRRSSGCSATAIESSACRLRTGRSPRAPS